MTKKPRPRALTIAELERINSSTALGTDHVLRELSKLAVIATDARAEQRREALRCAACEYFRQYRLAGQAFTQWTCQLCCVPQPAHHNTGVPRLCAGCAKTYGLCAECGGDIELAHRGRMMGRKPKKVAVPR